MYRLELSKARKSILQLTIFPSRFVARIPHRTSIAPRPLAHCQDLRSLQPPTRICSTVKMVKRFRERRYVIGEKTVQMAAMRNTVAIAVFPIQIHCAIIKLRHVRRLGFDLIALVNDFLTNTDDGGNFAFRWSQKSREGPVLENPKSVVASLANPILTSTHATMTSPLIHQSYRSEFLLSKCQSPFRIISF